ncbi:MAG TPA: response regulator [Pirellulales bacterium]|jgi:two-component system response regulator FixJ|nr:response regulator [Pirellulales bacterium]
MVSPMVSVVDDDDNVRESLAALLGSLQLDVQCYACPREFLNTYSPERPGCIVLDLRMPQLTGLEVIQELSRRRYHAPVIMISGHGDIPAAVSAMKAGAVDFLEKPYRGTALLEAVRRALEIDANNRKSHANRDTLLARFRALNEEERSVLALTAEGKPDKAIAMKLDLSLRTIQLRRASVMQKMQARSRAELIRLAHLIEQMLSQNSG